MSTLRCHQIDTILTLQTLVNLYYETKRSFHFSHTWCLMIHNPIADQNNFLQYLAANLVQNTSISFWSIIYDMLNFYYIWKFLPQSWNISATLRLAGRAFSMSGKLLRFQEKLVLTSGLPPRMLMKNRLEKASPQDMLNAKKNLAGHFEELAVSRLVVNGVGGHYVLQDSQLFMSRCLDSQFN